MIKFFGLHFLLLLLCFCSCSDNKNEEKETSNAINPNGDSELALLMREMVVFTQKSKEALEKQQTLPSIPENFRNIISAKKTDTTLDTAIFNGHATIYLRNLELLYQVESVQQIQQFNSVVNACVGCHESFCGGPIKRIRKFYMETKD
jgi:hypothetical protein